MDPITVEYTPAATLQSCKLQVFSSGSRRWLRPSAAFALPRTLKPASLTFSVEQAGSDLQVTWDRQSAAIRTAQKGILTIEDGTYTKPTNLAAGELQSGSVVTYRPVTNHVRFRLDLLWNHPYWPELTNWVLPSGVFIAFKPYGY